MTAPGNPPLKCLPTPADNRPCVARPAEVVAAVGGRQGAARRASFQPVALIRTARVPEGRHTS